jgi:hypothetical protein
LKDCKLTRLRLTNICSRIMIAYLKTSEFATRSLKTSPFSKAITVIPLSIEFGVLL